MAITRNQSELLTLLCNETSLSLSEKIELGIEHYIAGMPVSSHPSARQQIPYVIQFAPTVVGFGYKLTTLNFANPAIYFGGLTEYDKEAVISHLHPDYRIPTIKLLSRSIPCSRSVLGSLKESGLSFPVMLKANQGERGVGVYYLANEDLLKKHREAIETKKIRWYPSVIQQYIGASEEYCLQFYQYKEDGMKKIRFGELTLRRKPIVRGNGKDNVASLIQQLPLSQVIRTRISNSLSHSDPALLSSIPADQEKVEIVRAASIDFGTAYIHVPLDEEQTARIHDVLSSILMHAGSDVFGVGRFDLKAESLEDLLAGKLWIIEMNGVAGIPTHVYDEKFSIKEKYDMLRAHFALVEKIASDNMNVRFPLLRTLSLWPEFIVIWVQSFAKKGLTLRNDSPQKRQIREISRHILTLFRQAGVPWWQRLLLRLMVR